MEQKRESESYQLLKISNKRRNYESKGQIKGIEEQLRRTFISKMSKTGNEASYSART